MKRQLLGTRRLLGRVADWSGQFGFIKPDQPVDHTLAARHGGFIYFACDDIKADVAGIGAAVSFFAYVDCNGLGALDVRPASAAGAAVGRALPAPHRHLALGDVARGGPNSGRPAPPLAPPVPRRTLGAGNRGGAGAVVPLDAKVDLSGERGRSPSVASSGGGGEEGGLTVQGFGGYHRQVARSVARTDPETARDGLHRAMTRAVSEAFAPLAQHEKEWAQPDAVRRIVKYFYKAATFEMLGMPWQQAVEHFLGNALTSYTAACSDRPWFYDLNLVPAITAGCWEFVERGGAGARPSPKSLQSYVQARYEQLMEESLLEKAMWDVTSATFGDGNSKIYKALKMGHAAALEEAKSHSAPKHALERVQLFLQLWIDGSMGRVWQSVDGAEVIFTAKSISTLFGHLIAPYGEEHPFSCVPAVLTQKIGRPPSSWDFLEECVARYLRDGGVRSEPVIPRSAGVALPASGIFGRGLEAPEVKRRRATYGIASAAQQGEAKVGAAQALAAGEDDEDADGVLPSPAAAARARAVAAASAAAAPQVDFNQNGGGMRFSQRPLSPDVDVKQEEPSPALEAGGDLREPGLADDGANGVREVAPK